MGDKNFRLSRDVRPVAYTFRITPDLEAARFTGEGAIDLTIEKPTMAITLHAVALDLSIAALALPSGAVYGLAVAADSESQTVVLSSPNLIPAGTARLRLAWQGVFHDDLRGLYRAGQKHEIGVTQFEAADARRVFPCFDEPSFKAVWNLSLAVPAGIAAVSNSAIESETKTDDGIRLVRFAATPKMSSYLVALVFGPLHASDEKIVDGIPIRSWSTKEKTHLTGFAQECAAAVLPLLSDYFGTPYVFGKLDQLAIPDFEAGAMENAGAVTFREVLLLVDGERAPLNVKKRVAEVITHELAHQWFGNLVTMQWWDDLWLNEAFATWMAYKIVDQWKPGWRMWDDFESGKAGALSLDAMQSTHPIRAEVRNADEATENFDLITYEKGGAMLRMIEGYLGESAFRDGIRAYMRDHAYSNTVADDLWNALGHASGQPIAAIASGPQGWLNRGGFPLVALSRNGARVSLSQSQFHADPAVNRALGRSTLATPPTTNQATNQATSQATNEATNQTWLVPVVLRWADDAGDHETRLLLDGAHAELTLPASGEIKYLLGNKEGAGFYRVRYEATDIAALCRQHVAEPVLSPVERVGLISDAWALFRAGVGPLSSVMELLVAFGGDADYTVAAEVVSRLDALERRYASDADRPALHRFVSDLMLPHHRAVGGFRVSPSDGDDRRLLRAQTLRALVLVARVPGVVGEASTRLAKLLAGDHTALDPNLLDIAVVAAAREGDEVLYENLRSRIATDPDPATKRRYLVALASFESPSLRERQIAELLSDVVAMQDVTTYLATLLGNRAAQDQTWQFVVENWAALRTKAAAPMLARRMVESFGELSHRRAEVEALLAAHEAELAPVAQGVRQTLERLRLDEDVRKRAPAELSAWLSTRPHT